jgi:zona occludens toxin
MMSIVEGPPGAGKSFYCVRAITRALDQGKPVATNIALTKGWRPKLARMNFVRRLLGKNRVARAERHYALNFHSSSDLGELMNVRLKGDPKKESRGLMVLDEAHVWLNARSWNAGDRDVFLRFFSAHRHLGWDILLITQRGESIDAQIRALAEYRIFLRNLKRVRVLGIPIFPFNFFVAIRTWSSGSTNDVVGREVYPLSKKIAGLYNSLALAEAGDLMPDDPIWLEKDIAELEAILGIGEHTDLDLPTEHPEDVSTAARARSDRADVVAAAGIPAGAEAPRVVDPQEVVDPSPWGTPFGTHEVMSIEPSLTPSSRDRLAGLVGDVSDPARGAAPEDVPDVHAAAGLDDSGNAS